MFRDGGVHRHREKEDTPRYETLLLEAEGEAEGLRETKRRRRENIGRDKTGEEVSVNLYQIFRFRREVCSAPDSPMSVQNARGT